MSSGGNVAVWQVLDFLPFTSSGNLQLGIGLGLGLGSVLIAGLTSTFQTPTSLFHNG